MSESEKEDTNEPYQRAMSLRKRNLSSDTMSDVFSEGSTEMLDAFDDSSDQLLKTKKHGKHHASEYKHAKNVGSDRLGYKHHDEKHTKGHTGVMRFLFGRGKVEHDVERRKSIAARKSISKARRVRRQSGAGSQSQPEDKENAALLPQQDYRAVTVRKKPPRGPKSDALAWGSKPGATTKEVNDKTTAKTAKDLIAAAEARDYKNGIVAGSSNADSLKRKAEDMSSESKTSRSVRRKSIKRSYITNKSFLFRRQANIAETKKRLGLF